MTTTGLVCSVVAGLSVAYAVDEARRIRGRRLHRFVGRKQAVRRIVGSLLVAVLMALVYVGLDLLDPFREPRKFMVLWTVASLLVLLLVALAFLDLRELRANQEIERTRRLLEMGRELGRTLRSKDEDDAGS